MQQPNNAGVGQKASVLRGGAQPEGKRSLLSQQAAGDYPAHLQFVIRAVAETWLTVEFDFKQPSSERVLPIIIPPAGRSRASVRYGCPASCLPVDGPRSNEGASCQMRAGLLIKEIRQVRLSSSLQSINFQFFSLSLTAEERAHLKGSSSHFKPATNPKHQSDLQISPSSNSLKCVWTLSFGTVACPRWLQKLCNTAKLKTECRPSYSFILACCAPLPFFPHIMFAINQWI